MTELFWRLKQGGLTEWIGLTEYAYILRIHSHVVGQLEINQNQNKKYLIIPGRNYFLLLLIFIVASYQTRSGEEYLFHNIDSTKNSTKCYSW